MNNKKVWRGLIPLFSMILSVALVSTALMWQYSGQVDRVLGISGASVVSGGGEKTIVYKSDFADENGEWSDSAKSSLSEEIKKYNISAMEESAVLVKNSSSTLPFSSEVKKVTLLGRSTADPLYRLATGGASVSNECTTLKSALESQGLQVNPTIFDAYSKSSTKRDKSTGEIGEENPEFYTADLVSSFAQYDDAAIVMFSRLCGEGQDLFQKDNENISSLALHDDEKALLQLANEHFDKVIVLLNMGNPMELGWLGSSTYGADACLWIGTPGEYGFEGVANILLGKANPSGGLIDTYAVNSLSAAASQNFGDFTYSNAADMGLDVSVTDRLDKYLVELEGIYVGYKYYETRYEDCVLGRYNASSSKGVFASSGSWNYSDEVAYPFGYGLSYTTFERTITKMDTAGEKGEEFEFEVTIKNTGDKEGKASAQIYVQTPYTEYDRTNKVEKSALTLAGYNKSGIIKPGESETVKVKVDKYNLASYDSNAHSGEGSYILDEGDYIFATGNGVHEALNNILAAKGAAGMTDHDGNAVSGDLNATKTWNLSAFDDSSYMNSDVTGKRVDNKLEEMDINYWMDENNKLTYLTRQDWNTFPDSVKILNATSAMADILKKDTLGDKTYESYTKPSDAPSKSKYTQGAEVTIKLYNMIGVDYDDDEKWDAFINQLTIAQLAGMTVDANAVKSIQAIGFPGSKQGPGPDGSSVQFIGESVAAASFSPELIEKRGDLFAEEAMSINKQCLWGVGADIHRTPFGGRSFEYYSEDSYMTYLTAAIQTKAMTAKGLHGSKHFCGNDQETNRKGVCIFTTEQAMRQGPLKGFEGTFTKGGSLNTMTSYTRYGLTLTAESGVVNNDILRGEWGFKGFTITDGGSASPLDAVTNGSDQLCFMDKTKEIISQVNKKDDGYLLGCLRTTAKNIMYTMLHTNIVNTLEADMVINESVSWWKIVVVALDVVLGICVLGSAALYVIISLRKTKKED